MVAGRKKLNGAEGEREAAAGDTGAAESSECLEESAGEEM